MNASVAKPVVVAELARALQEHGAGAHRDAPETDAPPSLPAVLDAGAVRALREITAGDSSVFHDLVRTVIQGIDDGEEEIARGLTDGDARAVMMAAHKLRGSTGMVGGRAPSTSSDCSKTQSRDGQLATLGTAHEKMRAELAALRVALNALDIAPTHVARGVCQRRSMPAFKVRASRGLLDASFFGRDSA